MDFNCPICAQCSPSIFALHMHCMVAHSGTFFTCPWCCMPFTCVEFQNHAINCTKFDKNEPREGEINQILVNDQMCLVCAGIFPSHEAATRHYKEHHLNIKYISNTCRGYFQQYCSWDFHRVTSHTESNASSATLNRSAQLQNRTHTSIQIQNNKRSASNAFDEIAPIGVAGPAKMGSTNSNDNSTRINANGGAAFVQNEVNDSAVNHQSLCTSSRGLSSDVVTKSAQANQNRLAARELTRENQAIDIDLFSRKRENRSRIVEMFSAQSHRNKRSSSTTQNDAQKPVVRGCPREIHKNTENGESSTHTTDENVAIKVEKLSCEIKAKPVYSYNYCDSPEVSTDTDSFDALHVI